MKYYSQHKQDEFIIDYFKSKRNGVFVDIGAHDGQTLSNTYTLEKELGWTGICIEPMEHEYKKLVECRSAKTYNCAIYDTNGIEKFTMLEYDGYPDMLSGIAKDMSIVHMGHVLSEGSRMGAKRKVIDVPTRILNEILVENNIYDIDFLSVDVEGAELKILKSIDYNKFKIKVIVYENGEADQPIRDFMKTKGYIFYKRLGIDDAWVSSREYISKL
jgi:FkbM family methyltransferase